MSLVLSKVIGNHFLRTIRANKSFSSIVSKKSPTLAEVQQYNKHELVEYLSKKKYLELEDTHFEILHKENISGRAFFKLNIEDWRSIGFSIGQAMEFVDLSKRIRDLSPEFEFPYLHPTDDVYIFVDNSNVYIQGKYSIGELEKLGYDKMKSFYYFDRLRIDYGRLLTTIQDKRNLGGTPLIVGSRPPPNDSLWNKIKKQEYDVKVHNRNVENREKAVDMTIGMAIAEVVLDKTRNPGTIAIVTGDADYDPVVRTASKHKWRIETWFWNKGMSNQLRYITDHKSLDDHYKSFSYGFGADKGGNETHVLEIAGPIVLGWKDNNEEIIDRFSSLNIFAWWTLINNETAHFYFKDRKQLKMAQYMFETSRYEIQVRNKPSWIYKGLSIMGILKLDEY